jgi:hypothetical protein
VRVLVLFALAGCGARPTPPAPILANAAPPIDAAEPPDAEPEDCVTASMVVRANDVVDLIVCHERDSSTSEQSREQGFVEHHMRADLVRSQGADHRVTTTIASWTDGWEWGTAWSLAGELASTGQGDSAIVLIASSNGPAPGISAVGATLHVFVFRGAWVEVDSTTHASTIDVAFSAGKDVATVTTCEPSQAATPAGCGSFSDGDPGPTYELRWDGQAVKTTVPPTP